MSITGISPQFGRQVIDIHGNYASRPYSEKEQDLSIPRIENTLRQTSPYHQVDSLVISSLDALKPPNHAPGLPAIENELVGNWNLLRATFSNPGFKPILAAQPGHGHVANLQQVLEMAKQYGKQFYGIQFYPAYNNISPADAKYDPYMQLAEAYQLPVVIHTAPRIGNPEQIAQLAKRHPNVPIVMYHTNHSYMAEQQLPDFHFKSDKAQAKFVRGFQAALYQEAVDTVKDIPNIYLECSWMPPKLVADVTKEIGADRMLFGSDMPLGRPGITSLGEAPIYTQRINDLEAALKKEGFSEEDLNKIFFTNAKQLFLSHTNNLPKLNNLYG